MVSAWFDHTGILQFDDDDAFFIENYGKEWGYYTWEQFVMHAWKAINIAQWKHLDKCLVSSMITVQFIRRGVMMLLTPRS